MKVSTFFKKTRKSNVIKIVRKKIIRDDIPCGVIECTFCPSSNSSLIGLNKSMLILDANIIIEQIDAIENISIFDNVVIFQTEYTYLMEK